MPAHPINFKIENREIQIIYLCYAVSIFMPPEKSFKRGVEASSIIALLNRENAKWLEFHEILESRISRILWDPTEKFILWLNLLR